jgi:TM2 domain-containing membrane protein YozV
MDSQKVDMYILTNGKYFESHHIPQIRDRLIQMDDNQWVLLQSAQLKDPQTALIISILGAVAVAGLDRFYIGDTGLGIAKLLTCGGLGIWTIIDWFLIQGATRQKNFEKIQPFIY